MTVVAARPTRREIVSLPLTHDGRLPRRDVLERLKTSIEPATDCFIFCPGWLGGSCEARDASTRFFSLLDAALAPLRDRIRVARVAIEWCSTLGGATSTGDELWPELRRLVNGGRGGMRSVLAALARVEVPASPEEEAELDLLLRGVTPDLGTSAGASWPEHALSFWVMKRRADAIGERLGREWMAPLWHGFPRAPRLHLIGHSFGARLVTSAVLGGARPESLTLLLGSFSAFAFAPQVPGFGRPGRYYRVIAERQVDGPIVVLRSDHDTGPATFYRAPTPASERGSRAAGPVFRRIDSTVSTSGLGAGGARAVGAPCVDLVDAQRIGIPSYRVVNVDGSRIVCARDPLVGAHRDVFHPEIARLVGMAAGLLVGGPTGARPIPHDPLFRP
jgi:hypothetical protein